MKNLIKHPFFWAAMPVFIIAVAGGGMSAAWGFAAGALLCAAVKEGSPEHDSAQQIQQNRREK